MSGPEDSSRHPPGRPRLAARLAFLRLPSSDIARQAEFYTDVLGYEAVPIAANLPVWHGRRDGAQIQLAPESAAVQIGFQVSNDDMALMARRAAQSDLRPTERQDAESGARRLVFLDPDGNELVFGDFPDMPGRGPPAGPAPIGLQHAVFSSCNPEALIAYYQQIGFVLTDLVEREGTMMTAFLRCGPDHHSLAVFRSNRNALDHHCYETGGWNDIGAWADYYASKRVIVEWGPGRHGPGNNLFLFVRDPEGNWVEISADLEQVTEDRAVHRWPHEERTLNLWGRGLLRA